MLDDYLIPIEGLDPQALLADWRWLIGAKPIALETVAAIGNLFLRGESGRIYFLSVEDGTCECIAESSEEFRQKLDDRHNRRAWLQGFLVRDLRRRGMTLGPGQCYALKIPALLGGGQGDYDLENYEETDLMVHVSILGQLHRQVREGSS